MVKMLDDCSLRSMREGLHQGTCEIIRYYCDSQHFHLTDTPEYLRWSHGKKVPAYQGVTNFNVPEEAWDEKIEEAISWFKDCSLPFMWMSTPDQKPELGEKLIKYGVQSTGPGAGMAIDTEKLPSTYTNPEGLEIRRAETPDDVDQYFDIWCKAYPMPKSLAETFCSATKTIDYTSGDRANFLVGYYNGEPVATSMIFLGGGVAGLWWVTTMPEARGKRIGTAMTVQPLILAKEKGYRMAILHSSDMGRPIYTKLGFQCPPQAGEYVWMPE